MDRAWKENPEEERGFAMKEEAYRAAGIDYAQGLERFMGNAALYQQFLSQFLYDGSFEEFWAGMEMGDLQMAEKAIHTLKGTAGNLSMIRLFELSDEIVEALREGKTAEEIRTLIYETREVYEKICDAIRQNA